jgi:Cu(I)/Ag(I) efflux system protein CusF
MKRFTVLSAVVVFMAMALPAGAQPLESRTHKGIGVVKSIDRTAAQVILRHEPIESLKWPTMTMAFAVRDKSLLEKLSPEQRVEFEFVLWGQQFVITAIR